MVPFRELSGVAVTLVLPGEDVPSTFSVVFFVPALGFVLVTLVLSSEVAGLAIRGSALLPLASSFSMMSEFRDLSM